MHTDGAGVSGCSFVSLNLSHPGRAGVLLPDGGDCRRAIQWV